MGENPWPPELGSMSVVDCPPSEIAHLHSGVSVEWSDIVLLGALFLEELEERNTEHQGADAMAQSATRFQSRRAPTSGSAPDGQSVSVASRGVVEGCSFENGTFRTYHEG